MNEHSRVAEQEVGGLIARAGPRSTVPPEDVVAIKAAARDEWRELVREERRRRGLRIRGGMALAASVLLAVAVGWWWGTRSVPVVAPLVASVELLAGEVLSQGPDGGGEAVGLAVGGTLAAGATIETASWVGGAPARVALRLAGGQSVRMDANTRARLISDRRVELERGTLYLDSAATPSASGVEIVTVLGTVREIGTQFEVRLSEGDAAVRVRVRQGKVSLDAEGDSHLAADGEQLSLHKDGSVVRAEVESYGPEWDWGVATAPGIEIEGRSLSSFLEWVARETGRGVSYQDEALALAAAEIVLHGSTEGFTLEEALTTILTGSGLGHEIENGTILITEAR
jgi:hypothetical protein